MERVLFGADAAHLPLIMTSQLGVIPNTKLIVRNDTAAISIIAKDAFRSSQKRCAKIGYIAMTGVEARMTTAAINRSSSTPSPTTDTGKYG